MSSLYWGFEGRRTVQKMGLVEATPMILCFHQLALIGREVKACDTTNDLLLFFFFFTSVLINDIYCFLNISSLCISISISISLYIDWCCWLYVVLIGIIYSRSSNRYHYHYHYHHHHHYHHRTSEFIVFFITLGSLRNR